MSGKTVGIIIVVAIICLVVGAGASYVINQSQIEDIKTDYNQQINNLQSENQELTSTMNDSREFNRLFFKAMNNIATARIDDGMERAYKSEADVNYNIAYYNWAETYYSYAQDYCNYARDEYTKGSLLLKQAIDYTEDNKTLEYVNKYIDMINSEKNQNTGAYAYLDLLRLASFYYNNSDWANGDKKLEGSNSLLVDYNNLVLTTNDLIVELDMMVESSWRD